MPPVNRQRYAASRPTAEGESLTRYIGVLRERIWLIVGCTVLVFAVAAIYVKVAPRTYQAEAEMEVQPSNPADAVLSALPVLHQSGDPTEDVLTGASLVTTPHVADSVVSALHLKISPQAALGDISATPIGQAGLVAVQATTSSPKLSQRLATAFVNQTIAVSTGQMHSAIAAEIPDLKTQLAGIPAGQRYGPGSLGAQLDELEQLSRQPDPTLVLESAAALPASPSSPRTKLTLVAGLLGGLLLGIGVAFGLHAIDPRLRREEQLRELFGTPVLARVRRERRRKRMSPLFPHDLSLASQEGYRTLRTTLSARGSSSESRAYLVTGSGPGEGKSTTAISLAVALAQTGASVILLEADLRRPTFADAFALQDFSGIEQVLGEEVSLLAALTPIVIDGTAVRLLAAHQSAAGFAARLSYDHVRRLVNSARAIADFVVIDSPPLTAVIDALPFAQVSDEIVIVARINQSRLNKLIELDDLLHQHGRQASGFVVVGATQRSQSSYGGYLVPTVIEETPEESGGSWAGERTAASSQAARESRAARAELRPTARFAPESRPTDAPGR